MVLEIQIVTKLANYPKKLRKKLDELKKNITEAKACQLCSLSIFLTLAT
jgi:hypothetical protein